MEDSSVRTKAREQPVRPDDIATCTPDAFAQSTIRGYEDDVVSLSLGERDDGVVSSVWSVDDLYSLGYTFLHALPRRALENHDDGLWQLRVCGGGADSIDELAGRADPVPPPSGRTGSDNVRRIDEQHDGKARASTAAGATATCAGFLSEPGWYVAPFDRAGHEVSRRILLRSPFSETASSQNSRPRGQPTPG
jgi:hypothetical protein